jgi:hypothetical protein
MKFNSDALAASGTNFPIQTGQTGRWRGADFRKVRFPGVHGLFLDSRPIIFKIRMLVISSSEVFFGLSAQYHCRTRPLRIIYVFLA